MAIIMAAREIAFTLVALISLPMFAPTAIGEWESDSWISNIIGPERLNHGDEFGCHGYEGVNTIEENWVIQGCSDYVSENTDASRWGDLPISFGIEGEFLDQNTANSLVDAGFEIAGDRISTENELITLMHRNGASLEKGATDRELLESAEEDTLVSIFWRARIDDLRVREDKELISWLEGQDVWLTTWGEWHHHGISSQEASESTIVDGNEIRVTLTESESWNVPGSVFLSFSNDVIDVTDPAGISLGEYSESQRNLTEGWREAEGGIILTLSRGSTAIVTLDGNPESVSSSPMATFNGLHHSVTIVGHHTTNLFQWSSDFQKSELRFTWLLERPKSEDVGLALPALALAVLVAVPVSVYFVLRADSDGSHQTSE